MNLVMPRLGLTMTEGTLGEWLVAEGASVTQGQILFTFESEKATMEFESPAAGVLARHLVAPGVTVPCGTPVAVLETESQSVLDLRSTTYEGSDGAETGDAQSAKGQKTGSIGRAEDEYEERFVAATPAARRRARELGVDLGNVKGRGPEGRVQLADVEDATANHESRFMGYDDASQTGREGGESASPLARKLAEDLGLSLTGLSGSGPGGQITRDDVVAEARRRLTQVSIHPASEATPLYSSSAPLSGVRRVIAERMAASAFTAPHVTLHREVDASALAEVRAQINAGQPDDAKISYNTLLVAIVARALRQHPALNACLVDGEIHTYAAINVALAVDTPRGLLAPVLRNADRLTLTEIQRASDKLIARALAGQSAPDDLTGGAFTITNLGSLGVDAFTPIINQPHVAILGVGRIMRKPAEHDGAIALRAMLTLSLSFDHRIVDGAPAARFLQAIGEMIVQPLRLLAGE